MIRELETNFRPDSPPHNSLLTMNFTTTLLSWYGQNKRNLPWRHTQDPYKIWLSEIILQQTRVEQGMPYYYRFIERFPDLKSLASADENEVLKLWQGLGYYSRARNLLHAAQQMMERFGGFPGTYEALLSLKGIGDYTASAISSIAFNEPHAVVDGNVYRFLARYFGIKTPIDSTLGKKEFKSLGQELIDKKQPGIFNQAVMEFGAMHCKPANPLCETCPFNQTCCALVNDCIEQLPVKEKITKVRTRYFHYLIFHFNDKVFIRQRIEKDIWKGLFEFPLIESLKKQNVNALMKSKIFNEIVQQSKIEFMNQSEIYKHQLTHQLLVTKFYHFEIKKIKSSFLEKECLIVNDENIEEFAMPQLIVKYLPNGELKLT